MQNNLRLLAMVAGTAVVLAGCNSTSSNYDAPPEPGQTTFSGPRTTYDAPPEPGQTSMQGPGATPDAPLEPGQTSYQ